MPNRHDPNAGVTPLELDVVRRADPEVIAGAGQSDVPNFVASATLPLLIFIG